jgi:hypothetical protein
MRMDEPRRRSNATEGKACALLATAGGSSRAAALSAMRCCEGNLGFVRRDFLLVLRMILCLPLRLVPIIEHDFIPRLLVSYWSCACARACFGLLLLHMMRCLLLSFVRDRIASPAKP